VPEKKRKAHPLSRARRPRHPTTRPESRAPSAQAPEPTITLTRNAIIPIEWTDPFFELARKIVRAKTPDERRAADGEIRRWLRVHSGFLKRPHGRPKGSYTIDKGEAMILAVVSDSDVLPSRTRILHRLGKLPNPTNLNWLARRIRLGRSLLRDQAARAALPEELHPDRLAAMPVKQCQETCIRWLQALKIKLGNH